MGEGDADVAVLGKTPRSRFIPSVNILSAFNNATKKPDRAFMRLAVNHQPIANSTNRSVRLRPVCTVRDKGTR
jgi:hypothetical protein